MVRRAGRSSAMAFKFSLAAFKLSSADLFEDASKPLKSRASAVEMAASAEEKASLIVGGADADELAKVIA
jgi:hypothetical protein